MTPDPAEPVRRAIPWSVGGSLALHAALVAAMLFVRPYAEPIGLTRGEPITVDLTGDPEPAPRGNPALPLDKSPTPGARSRPAAAARAPVPAPPRPIPAQPPAAPAPVAALPDRPAPRPRAENVAVAAVQPPAVAARPPVQPAPEVVPAPREARPEAPVARAEPPERALPLPAAEFKPARPEPPPPRDPVPIVPRGEPAGVSRPEAPAAPLAPAPPAVAKELPALGRAPEEQVATAPTQAPPPPPASVAALPAESQAPPMAGTAAVPPLPVERGERIASVPDPGRGGGLRDGRGGVEGDPVPLDSRDPRYSDYLKQLRRQIQEKWAYPREAAERDLQGQLIVEIGIAKDGRLAYLDLRRSSGVRILDAYALNAVKLAQPFPPVPDRISLTGFPVTVVFNYILEIWPLTKVLR